MKIINVTLASGERPAFLRCAGQLEENPGIDLIARLSGLTQQGTWLALSRSDVLIIDEALLRREGFEAVRSMLVSFPALNCLIVMDENDEDKMVWAVLQGIRGVLVQDSLTAMLEKAIHKIVAGEIWMPREFVQPFRDGLLTEGLTGAHLRNRTAVIKGWAKWH